MQRNASLISFVLVAFACAAALNVAAADGSANRNLRMLIAKPSIGFNVGHGKAAAVAPTATASKSVRLGHLTFTHGGKAAPAPAPAPAPTPETQAAPTTAAPAQKDSTPASGAPAPAQTSAPVTLPRGAPVAGNNDINQALQCQSAFDARGGRNGITGALGSVCEEGGASFNALGCCQAVAQLLNSGNLNKCACNNLVYQQLCQEVKVQDLTCDTLRPTLVGCGLQC